MNLCSHFMSASKMHERGPRSMDHSYIDEHNIIARYGMGKLSSEECVSFEEHFVDCPQCQEQLETTQDFKQALKTVTAEDAVKPQSVTGSGWLAGFSWRPALVAVAACAVIFAVPSFFLIKELRLAHAELNQARAAAPQHRSAFEPLARGESAKPLPEPRPTSWPRTGAATAVAGNRNGSSEQTSGGQTAEGLPAVASIFALVTVRGGDLNDSEPVNRVVISRSSQWVVLSVDRDDLQDLRNYRATLSDSHGRILWQEGNLAPVSSNALGISVPSNLLHDDDYLLTLEGRSREAGSAISRIYPFRVKITR